MNSDSLYGLAKCPVMPALGLSWSNLVTSRFMLFKTYKCIRPEHLPGNEGMVKKDESLNSINVEYRIRSFQVLHCPWLARKELYYLISNKGIQDIDTCHPKIYLSYT